MYQITVTLGLKTKNGVDIHPAVVKDHLARRFDGLSLTWGEGLWLGQWEPCYTLMIGYSSPEEYEAVIDKLLSLARATNQEAVYLQGVGVLPVPD